MKIRAKKKPPVLGDRILQVHDLEHPRCAPLVIQLAVHGQTVIFRPPHVLPLSKPTLSNMIAPLPAPVETPPTHPPSRILVLDDDKDIREIYVEILRQDGYQVDAAEDGQAGWEALQARPYDLLITDHDMPRLTGLELVEKVTSSGSSMPVIIASASLSPGALARQASGRAAAWLPKPFSPGELLKAVGRVLGVSGIHGLAAMV